MKNYRNPKGAWINLSLCHRFYVHNRSNGFEVRASVDFGQDEEATYRLSQDFDTMEAAQAELDKIMQWANE